MVRGWTRRLQYPPPFTKMGPERSYNKDMGSEVIASIFLFKTKHDPVLDASGDIMSSD
jgi:hypothetical protein